MSQSENILTPPPSTPGPQLTLAPTPADTSPVKNARPSPLAVRLWCAFAFSLCAAMLAVGLYLTPSPKGHGTHQQLHMPPCGMLLMTGYPCPTCGCTTAVSYVAHGNWAMAFYTQPFGAVVGLLAIAIGALSLLGLVTGRWIGPSMFTLNWYWRSIFFSSAALLVAAWIFKIFMIKLGYSG